MFGAIVSPTMSRRPRQCDGPSDRRVEGSAGGRRLPKGQGFAALTTKPNTCTTSVQPGILTPPSSFSGEECALLTQSIHHVELPRRPQRWPIRTNIIASPVKSSATPSGCISVSRSVTGTSKNCRLSGVCRVLRSTLEFTSTDAPTGTRHAAL
jgi:hypothetical protein